MSTMYYRLSGGEPVANLKRLLPQIINPQHLDDDELALHGIARVAVERPPLEWWQQYGGRVLDQSQTPHVMSWSVEDLPLERVRELAWQRVKDERDRRQSGLMSYDYGGEFGLLHNEMTQKVRDDLTASTTAAIVLQAQGVTSPVMPWTVHENITLMLSPEQMLAFGVAALQWHSSLHMRSQVMRVRIEAVEDVVGVVAEAEWGEE